MSNAGKISRVFKTAWFTKAARKASVSDDELCTAIREVMRGQAIDLGGGVFKKRLDKNRRRSIILAKSDRFWVYEYLFAKQDRDNIDDEELTSFRKLAKSYAGLSHWQLDRLLQDGDFVEICHGH
ncbi:MAG: type II toxin-antitoxin system RelE/ParE family toxin [Pseudomonadales bacterium]|jgi:hypothetical protein|nr:type II toxin-antitoxin system RelE/ParE family toxin [Pseudomonadales bacterium]